MIKEWIAEYKPTNEEETLSAMREIMQEIALAGLSRTDFFEKAAFYGGTALRIFYNLDRFSEDLDFSLMEKNPNFSLEPYFTAIVTEFEAIGMKVSIREKDKKIKTSVESAFLKSETIWKELILEDIVKQAGIQSNKNIKIKIEVDVKPPLSFKTEEKLLLRPFSFYVKCFTRSNLFAGKMHAILYRAWKGRIKGRDWYDLIWYIQNGVPLGLRYLEACMYQAKNLAANQVLDRAILLGMLKTKIAGIDWEDAKADVRTFIADPERLEIWSSHFFLDLIDHLQTET